MKEIMAWTLLIPFLIIKAIYICFSVILLIPITLIKEKQKDFWEEHEIVLKDIAGLDFK